MKIKNRRVLRTEQLEDRRLLALDTAAGVGLTAQYYNGDAFGSLVQTTNQSSLAINWGSGAPVAGLNPDSFTARFSGQVESVFTEPHAFVLSAEGGVRLWINGIKVLDRWNDATVTNAAASVDLISGRRYDIQLEFRETGGLASVDLRWSSPSQTLHAIPTTQLVPSELGSISRRVWTSLPGANISALTSLPTYPNSPATVSSLTTLELSSAGTDSYGDLLTGFVHPQTTGNYRFSVAGDDAAELWLSNSADPVGKQRIAFFQTATGVRQWDAVASQTSVLIPLVAGQKYAIEVVHKENVGADHLAVGWQVPGSNSIEVIDGQFLSPTLATVRAFSQTVTAAEGQITPLNFVVHRSGVPLTSPLVVSFVLRGTATAGLDYAIVPNTVTIPAGATSANVLVPTLSDADTEGPETIIFEIVDGPGYEVGLISERRSLGTIQDVFDAPAGGTQITADLSINPNTAINNFIRFGGTFQTIAPVSPYTAIVQATISTVPANTFNAQLKLTYNAAIQQGDILWADFFVRSLVGEGQITAVSERQSDPFTKSLEQSFVVPTVWTRVQIPFVSAESYTAGQAAFGFFLGAKLQTLQFADIRVLNYGTPRDILPANLSLFNIGGTFGNAATVPVTGQVFTSATRLTTVTQPADTFRLQYVARNTGRINAGSNLRVEYYARSISGSNPRVNFVVQEVGGSFTVLTSHTRALTSNWTQYTLDVPNTLAYSAEGLQAAFNVGYEPQAIEIADIRWTNLSAATNFNSLPELSPAISYVGRSGDDPWRSSADSRIDDERQAALTVNVVDAVGNPINGAVVSIQQTEHAFRFGSAIDGFNNLLDTTGAGGLNATKYQSEITRLFNTVTIENSLKWPTYLQDQARALQAANWVRDNGLQLRGHNIVWPSRRNMPASVWTQYDSLLASQGSVAAADYLRTTVAVRVADAVNTFKDFATQWDVVNEPFDNFDVMTILGDQVVVDWFNQVRALSPNTERILNDYAIFARNGNNTAHRAAFDYFLGLLKTNDGNNANDSIERIGEQSHYDEGNLTDIAVLGQLIQSYNTQFALPIAITEFDVTSNDKQLQADYLRDYLTQSFSQPAIDEFINWGFWAGAHYQPDAALYNLDFSIRPHGQVYEDLVFGSWWTDTRGTTRNGSLSADVFKGDYLVTVTLGDQVVTKSLADFVADGTTTVTLPGVVWSQTQLSGTEGAGATTTATLFQAPLSDVIVTIGPTSQVAVSPSQLVFTPINWNIPQPVLLTPVNDYTLEGPQTANLTTTVTSADGRFGSATATTLGISFVDGPAATRVSEIIVGDGTTQRSLVNQVTVEFDGPVTLGSDAITVIKKGATGGSVTATAAPVPNSGNRVYTVSFGGAFFQDGSLVAGNYQLTINANLVTNPAGIAIDGDQNGTPGGNRVFGENPNDLFFRLFGDSNGDRDVDALDLINFRRSLNVPTSHPNYRSYFDERQDGDVDSIDLLAMRRNLNVPFGPE